jgi:hypothetical protein
MLPSAGHLVASLARVLPWSGVHDGPGSGGVDLPNGPGTPDRDVPRPGPGRPRLNVLLSCAAWQTDPWAESLPRLLEPMGVSSLRASSARQAERLIRTNPVHIAVVDLTLPMDEAGPSSSGALEDGGPRVLELLARMADPPPTVVVKSLKTTRQDQREINAALRWGAFAVVDRTRADLELMLQLMQRCLSRFHDGRWPGDAPAGPSGARGEWV